MVRFEPLDPDTSPPTDQNHMIVTELAPGTFEISAPSKQEPGPGIFKDTGGLEYPFNLVKRIAAVRAEDAGVDLVYCTVSKDRFT